MGVICGWRRSSNANEVRDLAIAFCAQAFDDDDVLWAFEIAVFAAVFEDAIGNGLTDVRQAHQLFGGRGVDVDASVRLRLC